MAPQAIGTETGLDHLATHRFCRTASTWNDEGIPRRP
jgi:hypothetical protein